MKINYLINKEIKVRDYLLSFYLSKSKIYKLFLDKSISIGDNIINENYILKPNDILTIDYKEKRDYKPEEFNLDILYEDDYFLIINKPKGLIIHDESNSLCNKVSYYYLKNNIDLNIRFAHRLDMDTTGVIIYVKCPLCLAYMNHYIETHEIRRNYVAVVNGIFKNKKGTINLPIGENRHIANKKRVSKTGKEAITHYEVLKDDGKNSLLSILLETGRTHQIRCHMEYIGHPLIGDTLYGDKSNLSNRYLLHSYKVSFIHPITGKKLDIVSKIPEDFILR
jgi:23S rRNA pseudouridine1911/1915/1917 synthase